MYGEFGVFIIIPLLLLLVIFFALVFLIKGMIKTFMRQPVVAILCTIFLFPIWIVWSFCELFTEDLGLEIKNLKPTKIIYIGVWFLVGTTSALLSGISALMLMLIIGFHSADDFYAMFIIYCLIHTAITVGVSIYVYNIFNMLNIKRVFPYLLVFGGLGALFLLIGGLLMQMASNLGGSIAIFYILPIASIATIIYTIRAYYIDKPDRWY